MNNERKKRPYKVNSEPKNLKEQEISGWDIDPGAHLASFVVLGVPTLSLQAGRALFSQSLGFGDESLLITSAGIYWVPMVGQMSF
jgi:hypothetical protein